MDDNWQIPSYYVVKKGLNDQETADLLHAMKITPILAVIIVDPLDADFGFRISDEVIRATGPEHAHALATEITQAFSRPVLIIGEADFLDAYYWSDGTMRKEAVIPFA